VGFSATESDVNMISVMIGNSYSSTFLKNTFDRFLIFANVPTFRLVCLHPCTQKCSITTVPCSD